MISIYCGGTQLRAQALGCGWVPAVPGWVQGGPVAPCVVLYGGDPIQTIVISDSPPTTLSAVQSAAAPLLSQEAADAATAATAQTNAATMQTAATNALAANQTFITAAASVTFPLSNANQQALVNQVVALSKQVDALIRLSLNQTSSTAGT